ncbi:M48 family metallopeptidase [Undibacterium seohonense]|uniref:M48 family metallopeptidase n=1 Tax=Undibacterium seohonense TaxID=1344950 RepID=A0ABR6X2Z6_9BURK|nr:SprT family zinc-dependent metalloprotease [Undibacterium seohonense]MBC3807008.1 M48 family metallopeptidase [Undibacterium seohonense]
MPAALLPKAAKPTKSSFIEGLQRALQLDFFNDLFGSNDVIIDNHAVSPNASNDATDSTAQARKRQILIQDQVLEYELRRSKRRSIGFLIADDGLRITAPRWVTLKDIENAIHEKQHWIISKLREKREQTNKRRLSTMRWEDGARLPFLGKQLTLRITHQARVSIKHDDELDILHITLPPDFQEQQLKDRIKHWLQQEAKYIFNQRMPVFAQRLGVSYHSMSLSSAGTRWGSCTSQGKIRLNWRLIHFTPDIIDYVVAHELSHLREMNHSAKFWATVESIYPEYEHAKRKLRQHASADLPVF